MADIAAQAHALLARGLHPFTCDHPDQQACIGAHTKIPCDGQRGKHPTGAWKTWAAHVTPQQIDLAWNKYNGLANIGVACGPSGIVVLDEDQAAELDKWCAAYGVTLPPTYEVTTGRGRHLYYYWDHSKHPIGNGSKAFDGFKIDVRGQGGMVIAEGSKHALGTDYVGNGKPIAALPQEVADKIIAGQSTPQAQQSAPAAGTGNPNAAMIPEGKRHKALISYAGRLLKNRNDFAEAEILFYARWQLCEQPDGEIPEAKFHTPTCTYAFKWGEARLKLVDAYSRYPLGAKAKKTKKTKAKKGAAPQQAAGVTYAKTSPGGPSRLDDAHIGEYIADKYLKDRYLITEGRGWMEFDGKRWVSVPELVVGEAVRLGIIDLYTAEANAHVHPDRLRAISGLFSVSRIFAIVRIAKGYLFVRAEEFDAHPDLLNVNNGVVDLRDGTLGAHDPALRFTKLCPTDSVPGATHGDWTKALQALPNTETCDWLQVRFGQSVTGYPTPDDVMTFLNGGGENGKTTLVDAIRESLGCDYAVTLPERVLLANTGDHPTELMTLWGARLAIMEELPDQHLNIKRLKDTHGTGRMSARYCGKDTVEWSPTHSIFVTTNHLPRIDEPEHAVWRRLAMVVFPYRYRKPNEAIEGPMDRRGDGGLRGRLRSPRSKRQREAVLAWLIQGAVKWYQNGQEMPDAPAVVEAAKETWRTQVDVLLRYMAEELVPEPNHHIASVNLYQHCADWLKANGYTVWSDQTFAARFGDHPRVQAKRIAKKQVRGMSTGQTRSHRDVWVNGTLKQTYPARYLAWVGVRFRDSTDLFGPNDTNGW